ncbi:hypothetical protein TMatcc_010020 [Talaromyces marneffei ATCC 18224]|uniref:Uncharacterized protein n=1 Tax=Talaromyces marneffei (strain ATCC 18224 / CBS 334.59 / QM 7333) TaxID=441960 RepID=B6QU58_TALMQ|nr:uncharacterized protein EYB26_009233 [Talaromyces marneffei]EEA19877.1 conserved hypothetical protein [Talaromyces marneffei ATCC 18224]KAE8548174.1 hypothetical protein EYB25_009968 [Talaromyces marneffei]QGA21522.1 hypothetical protein EYB26_009233 [Talaromyces marneffei]
MSDLRRSATEVKRDHDHKAKWAHGACQYGREAPSFDKWTIDSAGPGRLRPVPATSAASQSILKRYNESNRRLARHANYTYFRNDVKEALGSDSSSDETTAAHESAAPDSLPVLDDMPAYTVSGNTVLATAVSKAEIKYENKVTEKLVKEYEFVSREDDTFGYVADVDDFEIIDHDSV